MRKADKVGGLVAHERNVCCFRVGRSNFTDKVAFE